MVFYSDLIIELDIFIRKGQITSKNQVILDWTFLLIWTFYFILDSFIYVPGVFWSQYESINQQVSRANNYQNKVANVYQNIHCNT